MPKLVDLTGTRFGRLTVLRKAESQLRHVRWTCACECGAEVTVYAHHLSKGDTRSCGCLQAERSRASATVHGGTGSRLYRTWRNMKGRCADLSQPTYGGRGIGVCEEWDDFPAFRDWALANGYDRSLTIDRIDNDKGYHPSNCRWATVAQQNMNKRKSKGRLVQ